MNNIQAFGNISPLLGENVYIDPQSRIIGDVSIGDDCSVWPMTVIRGDMHSIKIGKGCSIQDGSVLHITHDSQYHPGGCPLVLGDYVTVGHKAVLHGCHLESNILVGMGAIVMDGAHIEPEVIIAAGTLVPPGKRLQSGYLYRGQPCKQARKLTDEELKYFQYTALNYIKLKNRYLKNL